MNNLMYMLCIVTLFYLGGCAGERTLTPVRNGTITDEPFSNQALEQYHYYSHGPAHTPIALLALDKNYSMESQFWYAEEMLPGNQERWMRLFKKGPMPGKSEYQVKEVLSPDGTIIALVYSRHHWVTAWFNAGSDHQIIIPPPEPLRTQPEANRDYLDKQ